MARIVEIGDEQFDLEPGGTFGVAGKPVFCVTREEFDARFRVA